VKITFLIPVGVERPSGTRYLQIARALVARGHRVRILALHPDLAHCAARRLRQDGVEIWYVGQMHSRKEGSVPRPLRGVGLAAVLARSTLGMLWGVLRSPADVYHLGKPQPINGLAALLGVMLLRRRRFYVDCDDEEVRGNRLQSALQRAAFAFWQWLLPRLARGATVNSIFLAERLRRAGVTVISYVPNGVDVRRFQRPPERVLAGLRSALGLEGRVVIAYAGTLALHNHPVDLLLDAFRIVAEREPAAALLLIGGGEDLPLLRRRAQELGLIARVRFTGQLGQRLVPALLGLASLSVDPVHDDEVARARSPLKIFESMALGVPVVAGDAGDRATLLAQGRAGILVPPSDPVALAAALLALLGDEPRRQALAATALRHVQRYRWERLAAEWEGVYKGKRHGLLSAD
jgi:glycosyltransferase involved in cell wall biosynthesis